MTRQPHTSLAQGTAGEREASGDSSLQSSPRSPVLWEWPLSPQASQRMSPSLRHPNSKMGVMISLLQSVAEMINLNEKIM